ncbi:SCP2 sterol-binding domain-containing protein [Alcaligenaceae bacterium]|nr:SCP2 sterol-binding domain-containing protein [Alcaligenaceae bacterium]
MLPLPPFLAPTAVFARMLNKLLQRESWARDRLSRHSGKTARFMLGSITVSLTIQAGGLLEPSDPVIVPDVTLTIPANRITQLPVVLRARDPALLTELMHIQGDAGLAQAVSDLARDLRWDIEDDLSGLVGDIAARRLLQTGRAVVEGVQVSAERLAGNVSEFISEESGLMASRPAFNDHAARLQGMQALLERLEVRVAGIADTALRNTQRKV